MANYNLETETTVHVKGMSVGDSSETGRGDSFNAIALKNVSVAVTEAEGDDYTFCDFIIITQNVPPKAFDSPMGLIYVSGYQPYREAAKKVVITDRLPSEYEGIEVINLSLCVVMPIEVFM